MNEYLKLKREQEKRVNEFPMMFAFSRSQFEEGMKKLGLEPGDTDKIISIGAGGFIRKSDNEAFDSLFDNLDKEIEEAIAKDETGEGFIYDMFYYELGNNEYCITGSVTDTLDSLGMTIDKVKSDERLKHGLKKAIYDVLKYDEEN